MFLKISIEKFLPGMEIKNCSLTWTKRCLDEKHLAFYDKAILKKEPLTINTKW